MFNHLKSLMGACLLTGTLLTFPLLPSAHAEDESAKVEISESFRADIMGLLEDTDTFATMDLISDEFSKILLSSNPKLSTKAQEIIQEELVRGIKDGRPVFEAFFVELYAKHYTHEEIKDLRAFYNTEVGRKLVETTPAITKESMSFGADFGKIIAYEIIPRIQERVREETQETVRL